MKRLDLLKEGTKQENQVTSFEKLVNREKRKLEKDLVDLKYNLEEKKDELISRLGSEVEVDSSVIKVTFAALQKLKAEVEQLEAFIKEYYGN